MPTLTEDQKTAKMMTLCKYQAIVDALKAELREFMVEGAKFSCDLGTLSLSSESERFTFNTAGKPFYEAFKLKAKNKGWGNYTKASPALKLTLTKTSKAVTPTKVTDLMKTLESVK